LGLIPATLERVPEQNHSQREKDQPWFKYAVSTRSFCNFFHADSSHMQSSNIKPSSTPRSSAAGNSSSPCFSSGDAFELATRSLPGAGRLRIAVETSGLQHRAEEIDLGLRQRQSTLGTQRVDIHAVAGKVPGRDGDAQSPQVSFQEQADEPGFEINGEISGRVILPEGYSYKKSKIGNFFSLFYVEVHILDGRQALGSYGPSIGDGHRFSATGLPPGSYNVVLGNYLGETWLKKPVFAPGVTDKSSALRIDLGWAEHKTGLEIRVPPEALKAAQ